VYTQFAGELFDNLPGQDGYNIGVPSWVAHTILFKCPGERLNSACEIAKPGLAGRAMQLVMIKPAQVFKTYNSIMWPVT
jgi:hypothetical protein